MMPGPETDPGPHWWEASALTSAPPLFPPEMASFSSGDSLDRASVISMLLGW